MCSLIIISEVEFKLLLQESLALLGDEDIVLDCLEEEPRSISRVEPRVTSSVVKVGLESVPHHLGEEQNNIPGFILEAGHDKETS